VNLPDALRDLVADEPPYVMDPDAALIGGRRRRHRRTAALSVALVASAGTTGVVVWRTADAPVRDSVVFAGPSGQPMTETREQSELEQVVRAHTPEGWVLGDPRSSDASSFEADVDDGAGASRLYVGVSPSPGTLQQHPCRDHEFALDSVCVERDLDADTRLITRGPAASGPVTSAYVVIVHRDGSGVDVGNDNATWPRLDLEPGSVVTPAQKRLLNTPSVNRRQPVYSMSQLVELAKALDAATSAR
jgi:hypothetical protein